MQALTRATSQPKPSATDSHLSVAGSATHRRSDVGDGRVTTEPSGGLVSGPSGRMLLALSLGTAGLLAAQLTIAPLLPVIIEDFDITATNAGIALTVMWACAALAMYPGGRLSDVLTRQTVIVSALGMAALGLFVALSSPVFTTFVIALALLGLGIGLFEPPSFAMVSELFSTARGQAFGIISASYNVGSGAAAGLATAALAIGAWQFAFIPTILLLAVVILLLHWWRTEPYEFGLTSLHPVGAFRRITGRRRGRLLVGLFSVHMFIWQGSASFYPTLVRTDLHLSPTMANLSFASIFAIGLIVTPIAGWLGDRFGYLKVAAFVPVSGALGLATILTVPTVAGLAAGTVLYAVGLMAFWPLITTEFMEFISADSIGADYGITRSIFYGVGSLGPTYVGYAADQSSYTLAYTGLIAGFLVAAGIIVRLNQLK